MAAKKTAKKKSAKKRATQRKRASKNLEFEEPEIDSISKVPPVHMMDDADARMMYLELVDVLREKDFVSKFHEHCLVRYCEEWARERNLLKDIENQGSVLESEGGGCYLNPAETARKMCLNEMMRQLKAMGLEADQLEKNKKVVAPVPKPGGPAAYTR